MNELEYLREYVRLDLESRRAEKELSLTEKNGPKFFTGIPRSQVVDYLQRDTTGYKYFMESPACLKEDEKLVNSLCQRKEVLLHELKQNIESLIDEYMLMFNSIDQELIACNQKVAKKRENNLREAQLKAKKARQVLLIHRILYVLPDKYIAQYGLDKLDWFDCSTEIEHGKAGVYFLFDKLSSNLDYIGHSYKIRSRLVPTHHVYKRDKHFIGVLYESDDDTRLNLEAQLIASLDPPFNQRAG